MYGTAGFRQAGMPPSSTRPETRKERQDRVRAKEKQEGKEGLVAKIKDKLMGRLEAMLAGNTFGERGDDSAQAESHTSAPAPSRRTCVRSTQSLKLIRAAQRPATP